MTERRKLIRSLVMILLFLFLSIGNFSRLSGSENIRAIHIVSLLVIGMLMGVAVVMILRIIKLKREE